MGKHDLVICSIVVGSFLVMQLLALVLRLGLDGQYSELSLTKLADQYSKDYAWLIKLSLNCFGYMTVVVPAYLIYKYSKVTKYSDRRETGCIPRVIRSCFYGSGECDSHGQLLPTSAAVPAPDPATPTAKRPAYNEGLLLLYCFSGLMVSFLTWGVLQEKIMTQEYTHMEGDKEVRVHFKESQFLVFANRFLAFIVSGIYLSISGATKSSSRYQTPLFKYCPPSISNILSAWFQYEALKFVNFPTQVLAKSCKVIPVMIMGKIVSRSKYQFYEYFTAGLMSFGMVLFMTGSTDEGKASPVTTLTGVFLLCMYLASDSFTSNWQDKLFKTYSMSSMEMMFGVNMFSCLFTASSLFVQSGFLDSIQFAMKHPSFTFDCLALSVAAAIGQLFIYFTISKLGAVVFAIIMTLRQAVAILLSCLIYNHEVSVLGGFGVSVVFISVFLRVYCNDRRRRLRRNNRTPTGGEIGGGGGDIKPLITNLPMKP